MNAMLLETFINLLAFTLYIAILGRVIISWINLPPSNPLVVVLHQLTEPILGPIRRMLPQMGMLDLSPMVALIIIIIVQRILIRVL